MKKLLTIILVASSFFATAQVKISALPAATDTPALSSLTAIVESGTTKKATLQKLKNAILKNVTAGSLGGWSLTGNTGTNPATNFIGTTDNDTLILKVNGSPAGIIDGNEGNTAFGVNALANAFGGNNTAIGINAGASIDLGSYNTAIGRDADIRSDAVMSTAIGYSSYAALDSTIIIGDSLINKAVGIGTSYPNAKLHVVGSVKIVDGTQANGYVLTSDANGLTSFAQLAASDYTGMPAYANNAAAFAVLGAGKLYYTDVAGEYIIKVTH